MNRFSKTLTFQVKATGTITTDDGQEFGQIEALGAVFGNVDEGNDRILPAAFKRTIKNSKERAVARGKKYLIPMLWQHDTHELIGGWYDLSETSEGLLGKGDVNLGTQRGREYYELAKAGMSDEFSIIYDIPQGGAKYDKSGVRDLSELRLFSMDPVTFGMNDATALIAVKASQTSKKTFDSHYAEEMNEDLLEDWQDVLLCSFTCAVIDAVKIGDTLETDVQDALTAFSARVMEWVAQARQYDLTGYINERSDSYESSPADYLMQYGSESKPDYGYMSRATRMLRKAGRSISASNGDKIQGAIDAMNGMADDHEKASKAHVKALRGAANDLASVMPSSADTTDGKSLGASYPRTRAPQTPSSSSDTVNDADIAATLAQLQSLRPLA